MKRVNNYRRFNKETVTDLTYVDGKQVKKTTRPLKDHEKKLTGKVKVTSNVWKDNKYNDGVKKSKATPKPKRQKNEVIYLTYNPNTGTYE